MAILATKKVLTLDYWKPASKIEVGDYLFDHNGNPVKVTLVQHYYANDCYEVQFDDHLTLAGDKNLKFHTENERHRNKILRYKGVQRFRRPLKVKSVEELLSIPLTGRRDRLEYSIQTTKPLKLPHQYLPVPPFVFGYWIANRTKNKVLSIFQVEPDYVAQRFQEHGYKVKESKRILKLTPTIESQFLPNVPTRIPTSYLMASQEQRIELLRGILYAKTRQYNEKQDRFSISFKSPHLLYQIQQLVESLGIKTRMQYVPQRGYYNLKFKSRLQLVHNQKSPALKVHQARRYITNITKIQPQMCVHIETDGEDVSFVVDEGFIACH
jgi:hypothetical protein